MKWKTCLSKRILHLKILGEKIVIFNAIENTKSKEQFLSFMNTYVVSNENDTHLNEYLESIVSWVEDMDGFYKNLDLAQPENINWCFIATLFYVGIIYE